MGSFSCSAKHFCYQNAFFLLGTWSLQLKHFWLKLLPYSLLFRKLMKTQNCRIIVLSEYSIDIATIHLKQIKKVPLIFFLSIPYWFCSSWKTIASFNYLQKTKSSCQHMLVIISSCCMLTYSFSMYEAQLS